MKIGDRVRIERNEKLYPAKGSWRQFRGKIGVIELLNGDEYGVRLGGSITWFKSHEMALAGSHRNASGRQT